MTPCGRARRVVLARALPDAEGTTPDHTVHLVGACGARCVSPGTSSARPLPRTLQCAAKCVRGNNNRAAGTAPIKPERFLISLLWCPARCGSYPNTSFYPEMKVRRMRFVDCVLKSALTLIVLTALFVFVGTAAPDEDWWGYLMAALLFACLITWNVLTTRWFLAARSGTTPVPWLRKALTALPIWARILLTAGFTPIASGALLIFYRNGVNIPVLIGGLAGLVVALHLYRRYVQGVR